MVNRKYKLQYLPLFYEDFDEILSYIRDRLNNPEAAAELINQVEQAILERSYYPESFEKFQSVRDRKYPYYKIRVNNYLIFYVVYENSEHEKIMEVRRIMHSAGNQVSFI